MPAPDRRQVCLAIGLLVGAAPAFANFGFDELWSRWRNAARAAQSVEERFVSVLDRTLRHSGTLPPDRLARTTLTPRPVVRRRRQPIDAATRRARAAPGAGQHAAQSEAMVAAMRGTLGGDGSVLQRYFKPTVQGVAARWTLTLVPLDFRLLGVVRLLRIDGQHADLRVVELQLADGDRSVMTIDPIAPTKARPTPP
jgi:hypothetical protein